MPKYKHLFFDLDHTLWDFENNSGATLKVLYVQFNLSELGITSFEKFRTIYEQHNDRLWDRYRKGYIKREELRWKRMWHTLLDFKVSDEKLAKQMSEIYLEHLPTQGLLIPNTLEILDYCKEKGYTLHLITNGFHYTQQQKLASSKIGHYFEEMITSENSQSLKPHPDIFQYALNITGAQLDESIMIGDALEADILGAKKFGMDQVYYNPTKQPHEEIITYEIDDLLELKNIL